METVDDIYDQISINLNKKRKKNKPAKLDTLKKVSKSNKKKPTQKLIPNVPVILKKQNWLSSSLDYEDDLDPLYNKVEAMNNKLHLINVPEQSIAKDLSVSSLNDKFKHATWQSWNQSVMDFEASNGIIAKPTLKLFTKELLNNFQNYNLNRYFQSWFGQSNLQYLTNFRLYLYSVVYNQDQYNSDETNIKILKVLFVILKLGKTLETVSKSSSNSGVTVTKLDIPSFIFKRLDLPLPTKP